MIDTNEVLDRVNQGLIPSPDVIRDLCDEIDRLRAKPKPQGKTVRARVAVAVDEFENWSASGWDGARDDEMKDGILDLMEGATVLYWLTADLPVPEEQTVEAEVNTATTDENATSGGRG